MVKRRESQLVLLRHGNTFDCGEKATWVGQGSPKSLSKSGKEQAERLVKAIKTLISGEIEIRTGPEPKQREFASQIATGFPRTRAMEVDYDFPDVHFGDWEGRTTNEILKMESRFELELWHYNGIWPVRARWTPSESVFFQTVQTYICRINNISVSYEVIPFVVCTNVQLHAIWKLSEDKTKGNDSLRKVATSKACVIDVSCGNFWIRTWNVDLEDAIACLSN